MYSIGEVSKMFNLSVSTLRFYDKEGLFLNLEKDKAGVRKFSKSNLEALKLIECLKKAEMPIKEIKEFMIWCSLGDETLIQRKEMFLKQKQNIENKIQELSSTLDMINYKCWYYDQALKDGNEKRVKSITSEQMPPEIKKLYNNIHK